MAEVDVITFATLTNLMSLNGLYLIGYAWLFGMCWSLQASFSRNEAHKNCYQRFGYHSLEVRMLLIIHRALFI
jgi:hypothetical protein